MQFQIKIYVFLFLSHKCFLTFLKTQFLVGHSADILKLFIYFFIINLFTKFMTPPDPNPT